MRRLLRPFFVFWLAFWVSAGPAQAQVFRPETFTLDNGMQVVVVTNRMAPVVTHMVWYRVGAADEAPGQSGIAHFLEHLMFRGTETLADGEFSEIVRRNGGNDNAFTSWDFTAYFQNISVEHLERVMRMEADRMVNLRLDPDTVETERGVVMEERLQRIDNDPSAILSEQMMAALYQNHPYGRPIIGWMHEIEALTVEQIQAFYDAWYAPSNAILVVSGDIDAETLRPLAEEIYGTIPTGEVAERVRPTEPPNQIPRRLELSDPRVQQVGWREFVIVPSARTGNPEFTDGLMMLGDLLGSGTTSLMYQDLVVEQGLATAAGAWYSDSDREDTIFGFYAVPTAGTDPKAIEDAIVAILQDLVENGPDADQLERIRSQMDLAAVFARDSISGPARLLGRVLATDGSIERLEAWPQRLAAISAEDVQAAGAYLLETQRRVTGLLLPADQPS